MKTWFLLLLLTGLPFIGPSLRAEESQQAATLLAIAEKNAENDLARAIDYAQKAIKAADLVADQPAKARAYRFLGNLYNRHGEYEKSLANHKESLIIQEQLSSDKSSLAVGEAQLSICKANWRLGDLDSALQYCLDALRVFDTNKYQPGIAKALHNVGIVYDYLGNYDLALENHSRALAIFKELGDQKLYSKTLNSIGIIHHLTKNPQKALEYYQKSLAIRRTLGDDIGIAQSQNNVGVVLQILKKYPEALESLHKSLEFYQRAGNKYEAANTLNNIGEVYIAQREYQRAEDVLRRGLKLAREVDAKEIVRENYEFLSELYTQTEEYQRALSYYQESAKIRDEIFDDELGKQIASLQTKYESEKKQKEIELLRKENEIKQLELTRQKLHRNFLAGGILFVFLLLFFLYSRYNLKKKAHEAISLEKEKTDRLLLNILPSRVAADLKETGKTEPESFENVTVYFSDIAGFTNISANLEPKVLIGELNELFTAFDNIIEKNQCERVKTIGDAYLCVCGMPDQNANHAYNIVKSATEILDYLRERNSTHPLQWHIRIGVHTGKVVGGVVGIKKYIYDVFGDTINTASRMESNSAPMRINVSESTYNLVKDQFPCIARGAQSVKGKGDMAMFFVDH